MDELAAQIGPTALLVGYVDFNTKRPGRDYVNAVALIQNGKIIARRQKMLLPTYDVFDEDRYFQPADSNTVVDFGGQRLGLTICEDIWTQDYLPAQLYERSPIHELMRGEARAQVLLNMSASPYHLGKERVRHDMLQAVAQRTPCSGRVLQSRRRQRRIDFRRQQPGVRRLRQSRSPKAPPFAEDLVIVDLEGRAPAPSASRSTSEPVAALHDALVLGLRDYTRKCGFKSVVLGLSGGIDSAVTACLAVAALGPENVMGVSMPSQFSSKGSIDDARELAQNLGIRWEIDPDPGCRSRQFKGTLQAISRACPKTRPRKTCRRASAARR